MPVSATFRDYYGILGITKTATDEEIKAAYKSLALQWHPDRHATRKETAGRKFIQINEAYRFLMDKGRREWYDNFPATGTDVKNRRGSSAPKNKESPAGEGVEVPAKETPSLNKSKSDFGASNAKPADTVPNPEVRSPSPAPAQRAKSESGLRNSAQVPDSKFRTKSFGAKNVEADLRDFIHRMSNADKKFDNKEQSFKSHTVYDDSDSDAPSIHKGVQLQTTTVVTSGAPSEWIFPLPLTLEELSTGATHRYRITRHLLSGKKKHVAVEIDIAPGWKKGTKIRFAGAGNERQGNLSPQDVVFIVEEIPHERFTREGSSLVARVNIPLWEALTGHGRSIMIRGLDGQNVEASVPAGIIKPGDECRVVGAGMPIRKKGAVVGRGDMIIRWNIVFPQQLSKRQIEVLRKELKA